MSYAQPVEWELEVVAGKVDDPQHMTYTLFAEDLEEAVRLHQINPANGGTELVRVELKP